MSIKLFTKKRGTKWMLHFGARVVNAGIIASSASKAIAFSGVLGVIRDSPGPQILSDDGEMLWLYSALWAACAMFALFDFIRGRLARGVMLYIPLVAWWFVAYGLAWIYSGFQSWDWMTVGVYFGIFMCNAGYFTYIIALRERIAQYQSIIKTGTINKVDSRIADE